MQFDVGTISLGSMSIISREEALVSDYLIQTLLNNRRKPTILERQRTGIFSSIKSKLINAQNVVPLLFEESIVNKWFVPVSDWPLAIPEILFNDEGIDTIVLQGSYEQRTIRPQLTILTTAYNHPLIHDHLLPVGMLKEPKSRVTVADCIVVTDCPREIDGFGHELKSMLQKHTVPTTPIFFTSTFYGAPQPVFDTSHMIAHRLLLIGMDDQDQKHLNDYDIVEVLKIPTDIRLEQLESTITRMVARHSQKTDLSVLVHHRYRHLLKKSTGLESISIFYLPAQIKFLQDRDNFDRLILDGLNKR